MPLVCNRYAEALFNLSMQENAVNEYQNELAAVAGVYESEKEFRHFLLNPRINIENKKPVLINVFKDKISTNTLNFLMILLDKNRLKYLPGICEEFIKMADKEKNILNISIFTAASLEQEYIEKIKEKFKILFSSSYVKARVEIDPSLLGGIKVFVEGKLFDASLKGKLVRLRESMTV